MSTLVNIGCRPPGEGLVELLLECHERIRRHTQLAIALGTRSDVPESEVIETCLRCERYFTEALPLHVQDEERSVLPRLRGLNREVDEALAIMAGQHSAHAPLLSALCAALRALRSQPTAANQRAAVRTAAQELACEFEKHLQLEEDVIFPAVDALVPPETQAALVRELRARRE